MVGAEALEWTGKSIRSRSVECEVNGMQNDFRPYHCTHDSYGLSDPQIFLRAI